MPSQLWPAPVTGSRVVLTYASNVARMGVLQGLAASANVRPAKGKQTRR